MNYRSETREVKRKPFDFQNIKVIIKRGKQGDVKIFLNRKWTLENIEHFRPVIEGVSEDEGIEITLTCNLEAFQFIVRYLQESSSELKKEMIGEITH